MDPEHCFLVRTLIDRVYFLWRKKKQDLLLLDSNLDPPFKKIDPCLVSSIFNAMHVHPADDVLKDFKTPVLLLNPVDPCPPLLQTLAVEGNSQRFRMSAQYELVGLDYQSPTIPRVLLWPTFFIHTEMLPVERVVADWEGPAKLGPLYSLASLYKTAKACPALTVTLRSNLSK